jgi:ketosteroid isomerase-like protein
VTTTESDAGSLIHALVEAYTDAIARRDGDAWAATWDADGEWELLGHRVVGRDAAKSFWAEAIAGFAEVEHSERCVELRVDGDLGRGVWAVNERTIDHEGRSFSLSAEYHDRYRRGPDGWAFIERKLVLRP